ncbi:MAG TPA: hypothetical protein VD862_03825 [Candidatus Paceibacterota bacterium]|nr:hypothetical protein [Candidatus Paceibacterota bacterium]
MSEPEWKKHPRYLADAGGLFGAPPNLQCRYCGKKGWELFYGHCRSCAREKGVPMQMAEPVDFHRTVNEGSLLVMDGRPMRWYPWWHWRRWFGKR